MSIISDFLQEYGTTLLYTLVTAVFGFLGVAAKKLWQKWFAEREKAACARTVVKAIEQIYTDLHGEEKLSRALESLSELLEKKGIRASDWELRLLIESALAEYNKAFEKDPAPPENSGPATLKAA